MKVVKLCAGIFLSCLLGTGIPLGIGLKVLSDRLPESSAVAPAPPAKVTPVYPAVLTGRPSVELGDFILSTMPDRDGEATDDGQEQWSWDWASEARHIAWSAELGPSTNATERVGVMRIHVLGEIATELRETNQELGWDITLSASGNPKFGVQKIEFSPQDCFGIWNGACTFETLPSLEKAGITAHLQCIQHSVSGENATYLIHRDDKEDRLLSWEVTGGSGGYSQNWWIEPFSVEALSADCGEQDNSPLPEDIEMSSRNQPDIKRYQAMANEALQELAARAAEPKGKHCTVRVVMDRWGASLPVIDASRAGNDVPLCDGVLKVLDKVQWPESLSQTATVFEVTVGT